MENLVKLDRQIFGTLSSEKFSTHFGVCCVVTRSIVKPTDANKRESRQKCYFFTKDYASQGLSYDSFHLKNNLLDMELFL